MDQAQTAMSPIESVKQNKHYNLKFLIRLFYIKRLDIFLMGKEYLISFFLSN